MTRKQFAWGLVLMALCQLYTIGKIVLPASDVSVHTMPILTPVSLAYEEAFRAGREPVDLHLVMDASRNVDPKKVSQTDVKQFTADRTKMLELRNQRHLLNVRLMDSGVAILENLTPEQWEFIQSQRDSIQASHEVKEMEALLQKWSH